MVEPVNQLFVVVARPAIMPTPAVVAVFIATKQLLYRRRGSNLAGAMRCGMMVHKLLAQRK